MIETEESTRCKAGDLWEMGAHRLLCGDCMNPADMNTLMLGWKAHAVVTDMPYGISGGKGKVTKRGNELVDFTAGKWDEDFPTAWIPLLPQHMHEGGWLATFTDGAAVTTLWECYKQVGITPKQLFYWTKTNPVPQPRKNFCSGTEAAVCGTLGPVKFWEGGGWRPNWVAAPICGGHERTKHPTQKPVKVISYLLESFIPKGSIVLDPFGGSGTTLMACEALGHDAYLMEIFPSYCDMTIERWEKATGRVARLLDRVS